MSNLSTLPKGDSAWLLRKAIERIMEQVSVLETNIGSSTTGNSANTQIIFNDNGTLRGDAGLVYNKTTDTLTAGSAVVTGAATITGDLTVHTSTLKVDTTNHRVGIGTASPLVPLHVSNTGDVYARIATTSVAKAGVQLSANGSLRSVLLYDDNAGTTYLSSGATFGGSAQALTLQSGTSFQVYTNNQLATAQMTVDTSGNVGIGVTPSAWSSAFKAIEFGSGNALFSSSSGYGQTFFINNAFYNASGNYVYKNTQAAGSYVQNQGAHQWFNAPSGTAGASAAVTSGQSYTVSVLGSSTLAQWQAFFSALTVLPTVGQVITATATGSIVGGGTVTQNITFTQAMTLDASGRLGIGTVTMAEKLTIDNNLGGSAAGLRVYANDQSTARIAVQNTNGQAWHLVAGYAGANNQGLSIHDATTGANRLYLDTSGNANIINGNLILGTSGKGIDFSATSSPSAPSIMTSELLADYEEGTWVGTLTFATTPQTSTQAFNGRYTKVGRIVTVQGTMLIAPTGFVKGPAAGQLILTGLPFAVQSAATLYQDLAASLADINSGSLCFCSVSAGGTSFGFESMGVVGAVVQRNAAGITAANFAATNAGFITISLNFNYTA